MQAGLCCMKSLGPIERVALWRCNVGCHYDDMTRPLCWHKKWHKLCSEMYYWSPMSETHYSCSSRLVWQTHPKSQTSLLPDRADKPRIHVAVMAPYTTFGCVMNIAGVQSYRLGPCEPISRPKYHQESRRMPEALRTLSRITPWMLSLNWDMSGILASGGLHDQPHGSLWGFRLASLTRVRCPTRPLLPDPGRGGWPSPVTPGSFP